MGSVWPTENSPDVRLVRKAWVYPDIAYDLYLQGRDKNLVTWDSKVGEFIVYAGLPYKAIHVPHSIEDKVERENIQLLNSGIRDLRTGQYNDPDLERLYRKGHYDGQKAIRLSKMRELLSGPLSELIQRTLSFRKHTTLDCLNKHLEYYDLDPIRYNEREQVQTGPKWRPESYYR